jgi:type IV fimbrial biogenesis protein FimT
VTFIEIIVTLVIISILTMIGAPSYNGMIRSNRLATSVNEFISSLNLARSEAVKRNRRVVVRKTGAEWENGWQVFVDVNSNNVPDGADDTILQEHEALPSNYTLRGNNNFTNFIRYSPSGLSNTMGRFVLCSNNDGNIGSIDGPNTSKLVLVNISGRVRVSNVDADNNGIPEDDNGDEIGTCTP